MTNYNAHVEVDDRTPITADQVDKLMPQLEQHHGALGMSPRGYRSVDLTLPAENVTQATITAAAIVRALLDAYPIAVEVMTEAEFDARQGFVPMPDLVSVTEAAQLLGSSRQAVLDRITRGTLQAEKIGRDYAIPRTQLDTETRRKQRT